MTTSSISQSEASPVPLAQAPAGACVGDSRRIKGLDVLRGIAASAVVVYHYTSNFNRVFPENPKASFSFHYGALGVQLFFLISGFVIFMTLEKTRRPIDFVRSRFSRLYPAYWGAILLTFCVLRISPIEGRTPSVLRALVNLTMIQNLLGVQHVDGVYWTLQVELCFYAIMLLLFMTRQLQHVEFWLLGFAALRIVQVQLLPANSHLLLAHHSLARAISVLEQALILDYAYAFLMGIMLYKIWRNGHRPIYFAVITLCLADAFFFGPLDDFLFTVGFVALVYAGSQGYLRFLENRVLLFLAAISYTLYLTHQNIGYVIIRWAENRHWNPNAAVFFAMGAAICIASLLTYCIERPALKLLRGKRKQTAPSRA